MLAAAASRERRPASSARRIAGPRNRLSRRNRCRHADGGLNAGRLSRPQDAPRDNGQPAASKIATYHRPVATRIHDSEPTRGALVVSAAVKSLRVPPPADDYTDMRGQVTAMAQQLDAAATELGPHPATETLLASSRAAQAWLESYPAQASRARQREGKQAWNDKFTPAFRRAWQAIRPEFDKPDGRWIDVEQRPRSRRRWWRR